MIINNKLLNFVLLFIGFLFDIFLTLNIKNVTKISAHGMGKNKNTNLIHLILSFKISQWKQLFIKIKFMNFFNFDIHLFKFS